MTPRTRSWGGGGVDIRLRQGGGARWRKKTHSLEDCLQKRCDDCWSSQSGSRREAGPTAKGERGGMVVAFRTCPNLRPILCFKEGKYIRRQKWWKLFFFSRIKQKLFSSEAECSFFGWQAALSILRRCTLLHSAFRMMTKEATIFPNLHGDQTEIFKKWPRKICRFFSSSCFFLGTCAPPRWPA